jgi:Flp pilus assembly protein TadG
MIRPTTKSTFRKKELAQTLVEFAIVFPVLLLITYGIMEFGRMLLIYTAVTNAAREGARYGATALNYKNCDGIREAVQRMAFLIPPTDLTVNISVVADGSTELTCSPGYTAPDLDLGDRIIVRAIADYSPIIPFVGLDQNPIQISRQSTRTILLGVDIEPP